MKEETKQYYNKFIEITGVKPLKCRLCVGSMKEFIFIEVKGTEEEFKNLFKPSNYKGVEVTFRDFNYGEGNNKLRLHINKEVLK